MGLCEISKKSKKKPKINKNEQPLHANIGNRVQFKKNFGLNAVSMTDMMSYNDIKPSNPAALYKYKSIYNKKGEHTTLVTGTLCDIQENSLAYNRTKNSREITKIDDTGNESSNGIEIISDGKLDDDRVKQSQDKSTIDNYIEYINNNDKNLSNSKIDVYNKKQNMKNKKL